jgi:hypothetical protein
VGLVYSHWKLGGRIIVGAGDYIWLIKALCVKSHRPLERNGPPKNTGQFVVDI